MVLCVTEILLKLCSLKQLSYLLMILWVWLGVSHRGAGTSRFAETWWPRIASFTCAVVETGCQLPFSQAALSFEVVSGFQEGERRQWSLLRPRLRKSHVSFCHSPLAKACPAQIQGEQGNELTSWWEERHSYFAERSIEDQEDCHDHLC